MIQNVPIWMISVRLRHRPIAPDHVALLAVSMDRIGLLTPVTVDRSYHLIAGRHRLEAAKALGWTEIPCNVVDLTGHRAELAMLDENLMRKDRDLTLDVTAMLLRRKQLCEAIHSKEGGSSD